MKLYTNKQFVFDRKYGELLTTVGVTFLFSAGMPILYPIAAVFCAVAYVADKVMLVYFVQRPLKLDTRIAKTTTRWLKPLLIAHLIVGFFMFGNQSLLSTDGPEPT